MAAAEQLEERVTADQIRAKLHEIDGTVTTTAQAAVPIGVSAGVVAIVCLVLFAFLMGRRRSRKRTTYVEIVRL